MNSAFAFLVKNHSDAAAAVAEVSERAFEVKTWYDAWGLTVFANDRLMSTSEVGSRESVIASKLILEFLNLATAAANLRRPYSIRISLLAKIAAGEKPPIEGYAEHDVVHFDAFYKAKIALMDYWEECSNVYEAARDKERRADAMESQEAEAR